MEDRVSVNVVNGVADVRLNRPDKLNALDARQFTAIGEVIDQIAANASIRVVVLSGEGRAFCAGIDLSSLGTDDGPRDLLPRTHGSANCYQNIAWGWRSLPQPVITAVHGVAYGAGLQMMLGADIRIVAPDTRLSVMEVRWGLVPDVAGFALMRGLVRDDLVRELTYTGRVISGQEAQACGLATHHDNDPLKAALALARHIADQHPAAIRAAKRLINLMADAPTLDILAAESNEQAVLLASDGHAEAKRAAQEKRRPIFAD